MNNKQTIGMGLVLTITLTGVTGCSFFGKIGKSVRNATTFGSDKSIAVNEELVIPPSLKVPTSNKKTSSVSQSRKRPTKPRLSAQPSKNYYVVVGTYPEQDQALDTFVRLSSIGLSGATMESRATKSGKILHMVRLGPYQKQEDIDSVKDSLTSDGLSQFKVVEN